MKLYNENIYIRSNIYFSKNFVSDIKVITTTYSETGYPLQFIESII